MSNPPTARAPEIRVRFLSGPIDPAAWAPAGWHGVGYLCDPAGTVPPALGLAFRDSARGRRVFRVWRDRFGPGGLDEALRVAIVEGPAHGLAPGYSVHLAAHPAWAEAQEPGPVPADGPCAPVAGYVVHRASPPAGTDHLSTFKAALARHGRYSLVPIVLLGRRFEPVPSLAAPMTRVEFRSAAEVGEGDIDRVCLRVLREDRVPAAGPEARGDRTGPVGHGVVRRP